jgi:hypothetical protein
MIKQVKKSLKRKKINSRKELENRNPTNRAALTVLDRKGKLGIPLKSLHMMRLRSTSALWPFPILQDNTSIWLLKEETYAFQTLDDVLLAWKKVAILEKGQKQVLETVLCDLLPKDLRGMILHYVPSTASKLLDTQKEEQVKKALSDEEWIQLPSQWRDWTIVSIFIHVVVHAFYVGRSKIMYQKFIDIFLDEHSFEDSLCLILSLAITNYWCDVTGLWLYLVDKKGFFTSTQHSLHSGPIYKRVFLYDFLSLFHFPSLVNPPEGQGLNESQEMKSCRQVCLDMQRQFVLATSRTPYNTTGGSEDCQAWRNALAVQKKIKSLKNWKTPDLQRT